MEEFAGMTPRYFATLCERKREVRRHEDFMLAQIASAVINFGGRGAKKWFQPRDLMPGEGAKREESSAGRNRRFRAMLRGI